MQGDRKDILSINIKKKKINKSSTKIYRNIYIL